MTDTRILGFLLHDVARLLRKRFEQRARVAGMTRAQWQTLAYLSNNDGIKQRDLADLLEVEAITLTRILDKLVEQELVERRPHPTDRRAHLIYIREAAVPLLEKMRAIGALTRAEALKGVPDKEQERLIRTLLSMKENLALACRTPISDEDLES
ncbi:MAG: MarR family transcriptional regulator [Rhizobiales bacterium]|nr:MarR family transcriptional regulator [Hyphomicrobiales bacterium]OJX98835.1 MAG: MarR family transcriptional regulator [Rhizobiales bacterium 63-22]